MKWISCYDRLPENDQAVIFETDHEGVWCGRFYTDDEGSTFRAISRTSRERTIVIGWNFREKIEHSEVHFWMPLPEGTSNNDWKRKLAILKKKLDNIPDEL